MSKRRRKKLPAEPVTTDVLRLSHEGRGIATIDGKTTFIFGALPQESIRFRYTKCRSQYDEGETVDVIHASTKRTTPPCTYFGVCGGCSLQHMQHDYQIEHKQATVLSLLKNTPPETILPPLIANTEGYRRKARLGVKFVAKKSKVMIGFREKNAPYITDMNSCQTLHSEIGHSIESLQQLFMKLQSKQIIPQLEVAIGDDATAIIVRHLAPLPDSDLKQFIDFFKARQWHLYLQPGASETIHRVYPAEGKACLQYSLRCNLNLSAMASVALSLRGPSMAHPASFLGASHAKATDAIALNGSSNLGKKKEELIFQFHPAQFTQINHDINQQMVIRAIELLDLQSDDNVLDLFCGIGNFSLPIAQYVNQVIGIEGDQSAVEQAKENATLNHINNTQFYTANLFDDIMQSTWAKNSYNKILLDPPRSGAQAIAENIKQWNPEKIVYVSCNPATLARDAEILVKQGYHLKKAGIMDMFPHTQHVEVIALFEYE